MASGDYVKTEFHNGAPPAINATALNNNENKTKELDTDVAALKSGAMTIAGVKTFSSSPLLPALAQADSTTKAVSSAFVHTADTPVSDISRILDVTGDGVPEIPDDPAGVTYLQDAWATTDGWSIGVGSLTTASGRAIFTLTATGQLTGTKTLSFSGGKMWRVKVLSSLNDTIRFRATIDAVSTIIKDAPVFAGVDTVIDMYIPAGAITVISFGSLNNPLAPSGTYCSFDWVYVGTGAYLTKVPDRSGNGLDLLNTAVTPVNTVNGRGLIFNGSTSFLRSAGYFTQPDVMTFCCKWSGIENLAANQMLFSVGDVSHESIYRSASSLLLVVLYWNGSATTSVTFNAFFTSISHAISVEMTRGIGTGTIKAYRDGILFEAKTGLTITFNSTQAYLLFGERGSAGFLKGTLSNPQLHSRALTADEHHRYHIDPTSVDSSVPQIPTLPVFADNAAAITGNLQVGRQYRTSTGVLMVRY